MKKINLLIVIMLIINFSLEAQNTIDPPRLYSKDTIPFIDASSDDFMKSWCFGSQGVKLDSAFNMDYYLHMWLHMDNFIQNAKLTMPLETNGTQLISRRNNYPLNANALHLEPTITVDSTNDFKPRWNDNTGAVFGFFQRDFVTGDTVSSGANAGRFILRKDSVPDDSNTVLVLSDIWKKDAMHYENYGPAYSGPNDEEVWQDYYQDFNGKNVYLSINIKNLETITTELKDSVILSIKIPYKMYDKDTKTFTDDFIMFHTLPDSSGIIDDDTTSDLDDTFYLGVLNRRTSPLFPYPDASNTVSGFYMKFLSTAEFLDSCISSPNSATWREYWWERGGCREFTIPLNLPFIKNISGYNFSIWHVEELGAKNVVSYKNWGERVIFVENTAFKK